MIYSVLTGDIVNSSSLAVEQRKLLLSTLKEAGKLFTDKSLPAYKILRGDSFQGITSVPEKALETAILIRLLIKMKFEKQVDARVAIGLGEVSLLTDNIDECDGEAFRNSGQLLEQKTTHYLLFRGPWEQINDELEVHCRMLDLLVKGWTQQQSEAVWERMNGLNQTETADKLGISQASVNKRLQLAHWDDFQLIIKRYQQLINLKLKNNA
ncbi:hypothetical protein [Solitalea canadensis]|uniref:SatD family (SatD) n=1 Tax=Solitalea canadensis (strain ATCC 29591 / DSM 3403 / JCM 21819 / LMG 8368 / NBRC 15130 / NCIMB 12057 / USAM 9D) TaxID=929556 RepID=H8KTI6_SOLCM|nr:hypothetical protein [Solitalea canadensis]AFD06444.1 hypothetical protein Solca_1358 [Solitalea canadensis DSM 3403]